MYAQLDDTKRRLMLLTRGDPSALKFEGDVYGLIAEGVRTKDRERLASAREMAPRFAKEIDWMTQCMGGEVEDAERDVRLALLAQGARTVVAVRTLKKFPRDRLALWAAVASRLQARKGGRAVVDNADVLMEVAPGGEALKMLCGALVNAKQWDQARVALARLAVLRPGCAARARRVLQTIGGG
jgi:hypothetical protein